MRAVILFLIRCYQRVISPWLPASCRYTPSCSEYARIAVERHGAARGGWFAVRRLSRCHPFGSHGFDPVPPVGTDRPAEVGGGGLDASTSDRYNPHTGAC